MVKERQDYLMFLAIGYLTLKTNFEIPIRNNIQAFIQSQA